MLEKKDRIALCTILVDRLITASMKYNEALDAHYSLSVFDARVSDLCKIRKKIISALKRCV